MPTYGFHSRHRFGCGTTLRVPRPTYMGIYCRLRHSSVAKSMLHNGGTTGQIYPRTHTSKRSPTVWLVACVAGGPVERSIWRSLLGSTIQRNKDAVRKKDWWLSMLDRLAELLDPCLVRFTPARCFSELPPCILRGTSCTRVALHTQHATCLLRLRRVACNTLLTLWELRPKYRKSGEPTEAARSAIALPERSKPSFPQQLSAGHPRTKLLIRPRLAFSLQRHPANAVHFDRRPGHIILTNFPCNEAASPHRWCDAIHNLANVS